MCTSWTLMAWAGLAVVTVWVLAAGLRMLLAGAGVLWVLLLIAGVHGAGLFRSPEDLAAWGVIGWAASIMYLGLVSGLRGLLVGGARWCFDRALALPLAWRADPGAVAPRCGAGGANKRTALPGV